MPSTNTAYEFSCEECGEVVRLTIKARVMCKCPGVTWSILKGVKINVISTEEPQPWDAKRATTKRATG